MDISEAKRSASRYILDAIQEKDLMKAQKLYKLALNQLCIAIKYEPIEKVKKKLQVRFEYYKDVEEKLSWKSKNLLSTEEEIQEQNGDDSISPKNSAKKRWSEPLGSFIGLTNVKYTLVEAIIFPHFLPHVFVGGRTPWDAILLYGPPGTGKTHIANALAKDTNANFIPISSSDVISKWQGDSERAIRELFVTARQRTEGGLSIIFIDEVDSIAGARNEDDGDSVRRFKTELLVQMQGFVPDVTSNEEFNRVFVLGATNMPWTLDSAFRRRFQRRLYIPLPSFEARVKMFHFHFPGMFNEHSYNEFASLTEMYSGADIAIIAKEAYMYPVRECQSSEIFYDNGSVISPWSYDKTPEEKGVLLFCKMEELTDGHRLKAPPVLPQHVESAIDRTKSTVKIEDIERYEEWTKTFGLS